MSDSLLWDTQVNPEGGQFTWENTLARLTPGWEPQLCSGVPHPLGACDALAGTGHALEAKPSCHPLVVLQISDLRVNFLWQLLYPKGEGGPDLALDKVTRFSPG